MTVAAKTNVHDGALSHYGGLPFLFPRRIVRHPYGLDVNPRLAVCASRLLSANAEILFLNEALFCSGMDTVALNADSGYGREDHYRHFQMPFAVVFIHIFLHDVYNMVGIPLLLFDAR